MCCVDYLVVRLLVVDFLLHTRQGQSDGKDLFAPLNTQYSQSIRSAQIKNKIYCTSNKGSNQSNHIAMKLWRQELELSTPKNFIISDVSKTNYNIYRWIKVNRIERNAWECDDVVLLFRIFQRVPIPVKFNMQPLSYQITHEAGTYQLWSYIVLYCLVRDTIRGSVTSE